MSTPNWPIRVGGEYRCKIQWTNLVYRVTEIDGDQVYAERVFPDGETAATSQMSTIVFRKCAFPEDQSPIPALVEALKKCVGVFEQLANAGNYPAPLFDNGGWMFALEALAKAGEAAVPEGKEVTA